jgi:sec-independent protein translocase protein TatA
MELGLGEIVVILAIVLLLFGPSKLPKLGEGLGSALANFRKAVRGDEDRPAANADAAPRAPALPDASQPARVEPTPARDATRA